MLVCRFKFETGIFPASGLRRLLQLDKPHFDWLPLSTTCRGIFFISPTKLFRLTTILSIFFYQINTEQVLLPCEKLFLNKKLLSFFIFIIFLTI